MGLKDLTSRYDRHTIENLGNTVEGPNGTGPLPTEGNYFQDYGNTTSPFGVTMGLQSDQMVEMLTKSVTSGNSGVTYQPSPGNSSNSPYQDLDGIEPPNYLDNLPG